MTAGYHRTEDQNEYCPYSITACLPSRPRRPRRPDSPMIHVTLRLNQAMYNSCTLHVQFDVNSYRYHVYHFSIPVLCSTA